MKSLIIISLNLKFVKRYEKGSIKKHEKLYRKESIGKRY